MKKKEWLPIVIGVFVFVFLLGGYFMLKTHNDEQQKQETQEDILLSFMDTDVTELKFLDKNGQQLHLQKQEDVWVYVEDVDHCTVVESAVQDLLTAVNNLVILNQLNEVSSLADYGLEPPVCTVTLTIAGKNYEIHIGSFNNTTLNQYIQFNGDKATVYAVDTNLTGVFAVDIFDLIAGDNIPTLTQDSIIKATIELDGEEKVLDETMYGEFTTFTFNNYVEYYCVDFDQYGLQKPQMTLTLTYLVDVDDESSTDEDGIAATVSVEQTMRLLIGDKYTDKETGVECYYVRLNDSAEVHSIAVEKIDKIISVEK